MTFMKNVKYFSILHNSKKNLPVEIKFLYNKYSLRQSINYNSIYDKIKGEIGHGYSKERNYTNCYLIKAFSFKKTFNIDYE